jgi:hypothetical protein
VPEADAAKIRALKPGGRVSDPIAMSKLSCNICSADLLFTGDERAGDEVFCTYCGAPYRVKKAASKEADYEVEEEEY